MMIKILIFVNALLFSLSARDRPNIFFFFADDWGRFASVYQDIKTSSLSDVIQTPNIDRIAMEGVLFENAFVPVASCGPCRASLATSRYFWNCGSGAFLNSKGSNWKGVQNPFVELPKFPDLLREGGYYTKKSRKTISFKPSSITPKEKAFGKVDYERYGLYVGTAGNESERQKRHDEVVENSRREIQKLLAGKPEQQPFFFIFGTINVHRPYTADSGANLWGIHPDKLKGRIPAYLPDVHDVRRDFSDYLGEVMAIDLMLGAMLDELEKADVLDDTLVLLSGDHGIPGVPRGKTTCYDLGTRVSLMARWPGKIPAGRTVKDFVSVMDIGPTFLEMAGLPVPKSFDGKSFAKQLKSSKSGWVDRSRNQVIIGRERHVHNARPGNIGYPMRAIRTENFLYIKNFKPDRWPMGNPYELDGENGPDYEALHQSTYATTRDLDASLTKAWLFTNRKQEPAKSSFELTIGKRPVEELYDLSKDPHQLLNLADNPEMKSTLKKLRQKVHQVMVNSKDPRLEDAFDRLPWTDPSQP